MKALMFDGSNMVGAQCSNAPIVQKWKQGKSGKSIKYQFDFLKVSPDFASKSA